MADELALRRVALVDQVVAGRDIVLERVGLLLELAVEIPLIALGHRAARMDDGIDEAAIDEAEAASPEVCRDGDAVGPIAIEQQRRGAVDRRVLAAQQRDRHQFAIP